MRAGHNQFVYSFFILYILCASRGAGLEVGIGAGVASYPDAFDPYELLEHAPVVYPRIELTVRLARRWQVTGSYARSVYAVNLYGCFCLQSITTNYVSLGGAFGLDARSDFRIGVDGLYGFCTHDHGGIFVDSNTYGVKLHVSAQQPLWRDLAYILRAGVQKEWIIDTDDLPRIDMTIFTVEFLFVLGS